MKKAYLFVRMDPEHKQAVERTAAARGQTMSQFVYELLRIATMNFFLPPNATQENHNDTNEHQVVTA